MILVTGGAGYIGSHAARALRRAGYEVLLYDNLCTGFRRLAEGFELIEADIADTPRLRSALLRVDAVMHFAAHAYVGESVADPRKYFRNNATAALSLLDAAVDAGVKKFVFSSTCAVYGDADHKPISEQTPCLPVNPYGVSKLTVERALEAYGQAYGLRSARLRYFNAAGADESGEIGALHNPETRLIPLALGACTAAGPELQVYGSDYPTPDGTCIRDYVHVNDLADAHVRALEYLESGGESLTANLGTGQGHSVLEVIKTAEEHHWSAGAVDAGAATAGRSCSPGRGSLLCANGPAMARKTGAARHGLQCMAVDAEERARLLVRPSVD